MPNIDDYPKTRKLPGSRDAMLERQRLRLAGVLNPARRGVRGLGRIVEQRLKAARQA